MQANILKHVNVLRPLALLLLIGLSACEIPKPQKVKTRDLLDKNDKPIVFKRRTIGYITRPQELGKYICQALENQLEDRFVVHKEYSATFILKTLSELPPTLQNAYATCYVESELKEESFSDYFAINRAFLGPQALAGYKAFGALPQIKILAKALSLGAHTPKNAKEAQLIKQELLKLDKLWAAQSLKVVQELRGNYGKRQFDAELWPLKDNS